MCKLLIYIMCLYVFVILPSLVFGQTPLVSTRVNEALKRQLGNDGKWISLEFSDGSTQSTASFGGDVVGPASSVDSEIAIYNSTTGKLLKRFAGTGILTATSGVIGTATTTGTGDVVLATSPTVKTPTVSDGAIFNLLSNNNITIDASTNPRTVTTGVVRINHTPGMVGTRPFTLNIDAAGFGDTHAVSTDFTATGIGAGEQNHLFDINVNTANSTGGEVNGFVMAKTGTGAVDCNAIEVYPGVNVITQRTGVETSIEKAFSYNGAYTDITSNLSSAASDVQLFAANGDIVYIGNAGTFNSLAVTLAIVASGAGIKPTFEYSAGASSWTAFSPTDGTNGFRNLGGTIAWGTLAGWATDTVNAVGSKYWVRITRTQNSLATPPTEDTIKYIASVNYGWDKDGDISAATLGIGTTTPATALHVIGTATATAATIGGVVSFAAVNGSAFVDTTTNPGINVGTGIVTYSGAETIVKYNASSSFVVPEGVTKLKVLVVAGGGGGGSAIGGGGGAGGFRTNEAFVVTPGASLTVTVGAGGAGGAATGSNNGAIGGSSVFDSITATGGGGGGAGVAAGGNGGSGGGARTGTAGTGNAGAYTPSEGNNGGVASATNGTSGGGGGASTVGATGVGSASGAGGTGTASTISGSSVTYAGGGGGGGYVQGPTTAGAGGTGGGGAGGVGAAGTAGDPNTGGGGGGGGYSNSGPTNYAGGAGGSGVVIVRFITTYDQLRVNDKFQIDNGGKVSIGGTTANNSLTIANPGVNGVAIDLRSDDTDLTGVNDFSIARLLADFTSGSYTDSRLYLQTATGDNTWITGLTVKNGSVSIGTSTSTTALNVGGTVTATGFAGNGAGLTGITATTNANLTGHVTSTGNATVLGAFTSANLAGAVSDETGTGVLVFGTSPTFTTQITTPSIVSAGALGITPASGSNVNVNLAGAKFDVLAGNIDIDSTTNANQNGIITKDGTRFIHDFNYGNNGTVTTEGNNTFFGKNAGNLTMGSTATWSGHASYNSGFGELSLRVNRLGNKNIACGAYSMYSNLDGGWNTGVGVNALYENTTGDNNTAIGYNAGHNAGVALQANTNSVFIGFEANSSVNGLTNSIAIGATAQATQSNQVVLGNNSITQTLLRGDVAIGTSTPSAQVHTTGTVRFQNFGAGAANFDASGNVSSSSDERLKNVAGEFTVGLNQLLGINPIQYRWNALSGLEKDNVYTGFSAQNVRKFVPEAVSVDSKGYYNLQDRALIAALVNAVKQLTAEIDELRSKVGLEPKSRISIDRQPDSGSVVKSKVAQIEKECGVDEVVKETKEVVENIDGVDVVKTVEVLKAGIVEKDKKFFRQENIEEATQRYRLISQEPQEVVK